MSLYLAFRWAKFHPDGGMNDHVGSSDCLFEAACMAMDASDFSDAGGAHVYDLRTKTMVWHAEWEYNEQPYVELAHMDEDDATLFRIKYAGRFYE